MSQAFDVYLGGGQYINTVTEQVERVLSMVNVHSQQVARIPLGFLPHGVILDPKNGHRLLCFEKRGAGAAEVYLDSMTSPRVIAPSTNCHFYGHGVFSRSGDVFFATETQLKEGVGQITIRDSQSLMILGEFPSYGYHPHDCHLVDDGRVLMIANGGGYRTHKLHKPCVTFVDVTTQKLLHKITVDDERFNAGHLLPLANGQFVLSSAPREGMPALSLGAVSMSHHANMLTLMKKPVSIIEKMFGEALSMAVDQQQQVVAVTHPDGNMITFWQLSSLRLLKSLNIDRPRGVALDPINNRFMVSYGQQKAAIMAIDAKTQLPISPTPVEQSYITGSHLYSLAHLQNVCR